MKSVSALAAAALLGLANAVDMSAYVAGEGVDAGFKNYLNVLYAQAELSTATTGFTDFFIPNGRLIVLGKTATGAADILAFKQELMPPNGNKHWNHRPNITTVTEDTNERKTFHVLGLIDTTYDGGNCSRAYYISEFPLQKKSDGTLDFTPQKGNLIDYDDMSVIPMVSPTDIPCE
ncbi:hypothetical protein CERZMDRAFT_53636 [Cercospora zeae-maydis SCOH1-5]|uniref:Uncharacterized protein n=1 Tax=Cercospora zeae-maydis SCOH1-5 TaxID=717836 RepID=A0A6A6F1P7_9PEZI|nr:hypothetical protein CERZMDRAFT_53636 [Cercospora zeae-maydis SCOH1-5]